MKLAAAKKVVIITEAVIEKQVVSLLSAQGVKGYTIYGNLAGKGVRGIRSGSGGMTTALDKNVCIEAIVVGEEQAQSIVDAVYSKFLDKKYAGIAYLEDIQVAHAEKF